MSGAVERRCGGPRGPCAPNQVLHAVYLNVCLESLEILNRGCVTGRPLLQTLHDEELEPFHEANGSIEHIAPVATP